MVMEIELTLGSEHILQHIDYALYNCTPGAFVIIVNQCQPNEV